MKADKIHKRADWIYNLWIRETIEKSLGKIKTHKNIELN